MMFLVLAAGGAEPKIRYAVHWLGENSMAAAINDRGQVAGWTLMTNGIRASLWTNGKRFDLGTVGGPTSYSFGLNNRGDVVGRSDPAPGPLDHAFLYTRGIMIDLNVLAGDESSDGLAQAINDKGEVVGFMGGRGFLFSAGKFRFIDSFFPTSINNQGQVAGYFTTNGTAAIYHRGVLTELGPFEGVSVAANAINERGQIAGALAPNSGGVSAFVYSKGDLTTISSINSTMPNSMAFGINNKGSVVGQIFSGGLEGVYHGFLYEHGQMYDLNTLVPRNFHVNLEGALGINDSGDIVVQSYVLKRIW